MLKGIEEKVLKLFLPCGGMHCALLKPKARGV